MHALVVGQVAREGDDGGEPEEEDERVELQRLEGDARGGPRRPNLERQQAEPEGAGKCAVGLGSGSGRGRGWRERGSWGMYVRRHHTTPRHTPA